MSTPDSAQARVISEIRFATHTGLCPVCRQRPRAVWPNGAQRMTCGHPTCFLRWLPGKADAGQSQESG